MIIKQFSTDTQDAASSYLVVDELAGSAAVVNPRRDVGPYIDEAQALGAGIHQVLMTHFHPDYVAAFRELRKRIGTSFLQGPRTAPGQGHAEAHLVPLGIDEFLKAARGRAQIIDVRSHSDFARAHLEGALNIVLDGELSAWAGTLLEHELPLILVAEPGSESEAAARLICLGLGPIAGFLGGGMAAAHGHPECLGASPQRSVRNLAQRLGEPEAPLVVDVRGPSEFKNGHLTAARNIPLSVLWDRAGELPMGREVAIISGHGNRSSIALSLLRAEGIVTAWNVEGGMEAWEARDLPMKSMSQKRHRVRTTH